MCTAGRHGRVLRGLAPFDVAWESLESHVPSVVVRDSTFSHFYPIVFHCVEIHVLTLLRCKYRFCMLQWILKCSGHLKGFGQARFDCLVVVLEAPVCLEREAV